LKIPFNSELFKQFLDIFLDDTDLRVVFVGDLDIVGAMVLEATKETYLVDCRHVLLNVVQDKVVKNLILLFVICFVEEPTELIQKTVLIDLLVG
jgi:hypothetical protein